MGVVYCIRNTLDNKKYIGSTVNVQKRWRKHKIGLNRNRHVNPHLQAAWNKYGEEAFEFSVVEDDVADAILLTREGHYMRECNTLDPRYGYNLREELGGGVIRMSDETRKKMSEAQKGDKSHMFGNHPSDESRKKMSEAHKGKKKSPDAVRRTTESNMKLYLVTSPASEVYAVKGMNGFCRAHGLSNGNINQVARGKHSQHKGYIARYMTDAEREEYESLFTEGVYFVKIEASYK